jgi:hypothetical protein
MLNLFKKYIPSIESVSIPTFSWTLTEEDAAIKQWINKEETMALSMNFFDNVTELPSLNDPDGMRNYYRDQVVQANGGLIEVDLLAINDFVAIKTIFKVHDEDSRITYLTSLTIPFESYSYVIKIQAPELGVIGVRESLTADKLMKEGVISASDKGYVGWQQDPYVADFKGGTLMNLSEREEYDKYFPKHSLSVSRKLMNQIEAELALNKGLKKLKEFKK